MSHQPARKQGHVPRSNELTACVLGTAVVAICIVLFASPPLPVPETELVIGSMTAPPDFHDRPLVIIDRVEEHLRIRILDAKGETQFDRKEDQLPAGQGREIDLLKQLIEPHLKAPAGDQTISGGQKQAIIDRTVSISRSADTVGSSINNLWVLVAFVLIFMMQPGFAFLESGLIRSTNVINVLFKNTIDTCISAIFFLAIGYSLMWNPGEGATSLHGGIGRGWISPYAWPDGIRPAVHFLFQLAFAMTAGTIISGAVAGRIKLWAYMIITVIMSTFIYPVSGWWAWSEHGWLKQLHFHDFAGSSVVHCVGGFAGLAGAILLGPRIALFTRKDPVITNDMESAEAKAADLLNYNQSANKPHSVALATLGAFLLWIGWFGFNGGSEMAIYGVDATNANHADRVGRIIMNTFVSGCAGGLFAMLGSIIWTVMTRDHQAEGNWLQLDLEDVLNGVLGGLVAITACCDLVQHPATAVFIGGLAGALVFATVSFLYAGRARFNIDDPVGAVAVHAVCGMLGTLACGFLDGGPGLGVQLIGVAAIGGWSFLTSFSVFWILKRLGWLRSSPLEEICGLDRSHHGKSAYKI